MLTWNKNSVGRPIQFVLLLTVLTPSAWSWGDNDRVLLDDVKVLTLYHGRMTASRRTSPVPQLQCIGGTAGCNKFKPQVVQCHNQGSDGFAVQWECKTDMDNAYRFGKIEVVCEGYDHPGDKYILRGSCGLEYTLDLTKEGMNQGSGNNHDYYGNKGGGDNFFGNHKSRSFGGADLIVLAIIAIVIYAMYKTCIANNQWSNTNDDHPDPYQPRGTGDYGGGYGPSAPPPPGFRPEYRQDSGASCGQGYGSGSSGSSGGGGFWTGAATGGILGYMFGNRKFSRFSLTCGNPVIQHGHCRRKKQLGLQHRLQNFAHVGWWIWKWKQWIRQWRIQQWGRRRWQQWNQNSFWFRRIADKIVLLL